MRIDKRHMLAAVSASNLIFFPVWRIVLSGEADFFRSSYGRNALIAVLLNVCLLAALLLVVIAWIRRKQSRASSIVARWGLLLVFLFSCQLITIAIALQSHENTLGLLLVAMAVAILAFAYLKHSRRMAPVLILLLALASPGVLVTFGQATWRLLRGNGQFEPGHNVPMAPGLPTHRVVWVVFDEWDERLTFSSRPQDLSLPNLDRLRAESFIATNALPPSYDTFVSFASLFTGRPYKGYRARSASLLEIADQNGWHDLRTLPLMFSSLREAGINTAAVSWGMPLCRMIPGQLNACTFEPCAVLVPEEAPLLTTIAAHAYTSVPGLPFSGVYVERRNARLRQRHIQAYRQTLLAAQRLASDPRFGFVVLHMPVPHPPGIYDRHKNEFATDERGSYVDNLVLVDRVIAELRSAMEAAGIWDTSTVVLLGDHSWRAANWKPIWTPEDAAHASALDPRVPFLVKLAGQKHSLEYSEQFNTLLLHDLTLSILKGKITNPDELKIWLDVNRNRPEGRRQPAS